MNVTAGQQKDAGHLLLHGLLLVASTRDLAAIEGVDIYNSKHETKLVSQQSTGIPTQKISFPINRFHSR